MERKGRWGEGGRVGIVVRWLGSCLLVRVGEVRDEVWEGGRPLDGEVNIEGFLGAG